MDLVALRQTLGLASDASEEAILAAVTANATAVSTHSSQTAAIAQHLGLAADAAHPAIVIALQARAAGATDADQLRQTVVQLQTSLTELQQTTARSTAERVIDGAIKAGKVGLVPLRDHYITRHMADPAGVAKEIGAMVSLNAAGSVVPPRDPKVPTSALSAGDREVCELMGLDPEKFAATSKLTVEKL